MTTYTVYHGGSLLGTGRWSGPHATRAEAEDSARQCRQVCGGSPTIEPDIDRDMGTVAGLPAGERLLED